MHPTQPAPIKFRARDGIELSMRHVSSALPERATRGAVVLQHGLGSTRAVFEYPSRCYADALAKSGYDVYLPHLRGVDAAAGSYGVDAYIEHDIPAIIDEVRERSGRERLHWIGHSMGGVLLMMYAIEHPDVPISRFIGVGSALDYRPGHSVFVDLLPLRAALNRLLLKALPFGQLARVNARVAGRGPCLPPEKMNFWRANLEPEIIRHVLGQGFTPIPMQLLNDLSSALLTGLARQNGALAYLERASAYRLPTCLIAGTRDEQCPESAVEATARLLTGAPQLHIARFGRRYGQREDYGHFDLILGARAPVETWPTMLAFLCEDPHPPAP